tara:strand:+ start:5360 stop:5827 length:468 start_codon:yes stop_codon:yes gene_type:complete
MRKETILQIIKNNPGVSYNEIKRKTKLSNGVISHYILQLIEAGTLQKFGKTRSKYFHFQVSKNDRKIIVLLRNNTNLSIVKLLINSHAIITSDEIKKKIKKSSSTVSVSLKNLQKLGIVEREIMNKKLKITSDIGYLIKNKKYLNIFLIKYNIQI